MQWWALKKQVHVSWLVAVFSIAVVMGVVAAQWATGGSWVPWSIASLLIIGFVLWKRYVVLAPALIMAGMVLGLWRGAIDQRQLTIYRHIYETKVVFEGQVSDDADLSKQGDTVLRVGTLSSQKTGLPGKIWVSTRTKYEVKRGDSVTIEGKLETGFGGFAGAMYRATIINVQRPEPGDVARRVRDWFADTIRLAIPDPQASLGIGYLVGQRRSLPPDLDQALQVVGLTHIVVASGYNLTILVRLARRLFVRISKYLATLSASMMIAVFIAITGASPSMSRAGLVAGLSLAAWYYGRRFHPLVLLPFAAAVTVMINPSFAWNDLGWQLSFAAFAGVMILAPLLQRYFYGETAPGTVRQIVGETVAAFIMTLPILIVTFGQISNVAILANVLVLPFVPFAMLLTFVAGVGAMILPGWAEMIGLPAQWLLGYMIYVADYLAKLPWAMSEVHVGMGVGMFMYVGIGAAVVWLWRMTRYDLREVNIVE